MAEELYTHAERHAAQARLADRGVVPARGAITDGTIEAIYHAMAERGDVGSPAIRVLLEEREILLARLADTREEQ